MPFTTLPNYIIRGGHGSHNIAVLMTILSHGVCWASAETIAKETGCSRRTVYNAISYWKKEGKKYGIGIVSEPKDGHTTTHQIVLSLSTTDSEPVQPVHTARAIGAHPRAIGAHIRRTLKNNPEEGENFENLSTPTQPSKKKRPYIEGDPAWQDPNDPYHWRVQIHTGDWVDYAGSLKDNLVWK